MINYDKHHFGGFKHQEWWTMSFQDTKKSEDLLQKHGCPRLGWVWFNNISSGRISSSLGWRIVRLDSQTAKMVLPLRQKNSHLPRLLKDWMTLSGAPMSWFHKACWKHIWGQWNFFGDFNSMELKNHTWFPRKGRSLFDNPFEWGPLLTSQATVPQGLPKWAWNGVSLQEIKYSQITYHYQLISTIINLHQMGDHGLKIV